MGRSGKRAGGQFLNEWVGIRISPPMHINLVRVALVLMDINAHLSAATFSAQAGGDLSQRQAFSSARRVPDPYRALVILEPIFQK